MTKIAGSISQRHGSADPDPHQNVMDPEHCLLEFRILPVQKFEFKLQTEMCAKLQNCSLCAQKFDTNPLILLRWRKQETLL